MASVLDLPQQVADGETATASAPADLSRRAAVAAVGAAMAAGAALRLVNLDALGFNSDEAVYAGQAASLARNEQFMDAFPVFRAHPMLIQSVLSLVYRTGEHDTAGRVVVALFGVATLPVVYLIGRELYGRTVGALAAALLALMPYHVLVTRQVLLDGPMVFFATVSLFCLTRWARTHRLVWCIATGGAMGLTVLAKESSIVLLGGVYAFIALTPTLRAAFRSSLLALLVMGVVIAAHPVSVSLAGHVSTGKAYLVWQLLRRPNHTWTFYAETVPWAVGPLVLVAVAVALWKVPGDSAWREVLLGAWIAAPVVAFTVWPVKGFQYLLPVAPALVVLAARGVQRLRTPAWAAERVHRLADRPAFARRTAVVHRIGESGVRVAAAALVLLSLVAVSASGVRKTDATVLLAGTGGLPGGREVGHWIGAHTPAGATVMTLGPSMANVIQYYGHREAYGLSVSPNPLHRNPSYEPILNPDRQLRQAELQYIVWDRYSAERSPHFSEDLLQLARRYHGRAVHTEYVDGRDAAGHRTQVPVIVVYEVRP